MEDINKSAVDSVMDEVSVDINVFHLGMRLGVMSACNSALVIAVEWSGKLLWKAKFMKKGAEPKGLLDAMGACEVLGFTRG